MTQKKLTPLGNRVLVRRVEEQETSSIILPDTAKKKQEMAEVIAIGHGKKNDTPPSVKIGDTVLVDKYAGQEVTINDDEEFLIVRFDDIIAIVNK